LKNASGVAIFTEREEIKSLDLERIYSSMHKPALLFDGRNLLNKEALEKIGFMVHAIGKSSR